VIEIGIWNSDLDLGIWNLGFGIWDLQMSCPVCFNGAAADDTVRQSVNLGIIVLLGFTGIVLGGFVRFIVSIVRRSRADLKVGLYDRADRRGAPLPADVEAGLQAGLRDVDAGLQAGLLDVEAGLQAGLRL